MPPTPPRRSRSPTTTPTARPPSTSRPSAGHVASARRRRERRRSRERCPTPLPPAASPVSRANPLTITLPAFTIHLALVLISAVVKAGEKTQAAAPLATPADELLHDIAGVGAGAKPRILRMEVTAYCPCRK